MTPLYLDVHVPAAIAAQLRTRGVNVITAQEDAAMEFEDAALFTQDIRFKALAENWQRAGRPFSGLIFGHQLHGTIGQYVRDLELIAKATDFTDWQSQVEQLPLR